MIDMNKKYRTRGGRDVTLLTTSGRGGWPIVGYITENGDLPEAWSATGQYYEDTKSDLDLVEVVEPVTEELWVNLYPPNSRLPACHSSKAIADYRAKPDRIACVKVTVTYKPGDGLGG